MKPKDHLDKLIPLYLYDELDDARRQEFEVHIRFCEACREKLERMRTLHAVLDRKPLLEPDDSALQRWRLGLRDRLRTERQASANDPWWVRLEQWLSGRRLAAQLAGAVAMLLVGIWFGRFLLAPEESKLTTNPVAVSREEVTEVAQPLIANIQTIEYDPNSGQVTVRYKSINDVALQGSLDDPAIRHLLTYAVRREKNPGHRLTAVKALGSRPMGGSEDIHQALIHAMENDEVSGVRLRAARALSQMPLNEAVKNAFIRVLLKDENPALRIQAINALSQMPTQEEEDLAPIFKEAAKEDSSAFIRYKASKIIEKLPDSVLEQEDQ